MAITTQQHFAVHILENRLARLNAFANPINIFCTSFEHVIQRPLAQGHEGGKYALCAQMIFGLAFTMTTSPSAKVIKC
jgi:hypothetical protein